ncbi:MAG: helix-turn-helix domain-containing protein [Oscillospiraceae bacterium]
MQSHFSRIITLLRKEKGVTQKQVAIDLKISQALLSHYEKGIRECGLNFVVKVSNYYGVSCDYLLGKSPDRQGATINLDDIPDYDNNKINQVKGTNSILPGLNKKLINNSLSILFDMLSKSNNKGLIIEVSSYIMVSIYKMFRLICSSNPKNQDKMFSIDKNVYKHFTDASLSNSEGSVSALLNGISVHGYNTVSETDSFLINNETLSSQYPMFSSSLLNLIQNAENKTNKLNEEK